MTSHQETAKIAAMIEAIRPILAGHPAALQSAALADCLAIWLAGHYISGDEAATLTMRAEMLAMHCSLVRQLVPLNAKQIGTTE